jgi:hypothetical protein
VGVWIDYRKAVIVSVTREGAAVHYLYSNVEEELVHSGEDRADDVQQRRHQARLRDFYLLVMAQLLDAESVYIFGPGEAKYEFEKELRRHHLTAEPFRVETSDKMTDRQIVEKVRNYFQPLNVVQCREVATDATVNIYCPSAA